MKHKMRIFLLSVHKLSVLVLQLGGSDQCSNLTKGKLIIQRIYTSLLTELIESFFLI